MPKKKEKETNTNDNKRIVLIVIAVIAFIGAIIFAIMTINKSNKKAEEFKIDGIDIIKNKDILKDTKVDTLDITNQVLYNKNDSSSFSAIINNNNDTDYYIKELYVVFNIGEEKKKILVTRDTTIKANDKKVIDISFDSDMLNVTKIDYMIEK